ncbi:hypothetical protein OUZ56_018443 [Daphnia magna]|uniref:Guanylate cyclase domain-containing protein n=1 Tax=Daphnia magna TaxID=35525 RepID=A0ABQ9Z8X4_9CRUS|nr:hypothetical protein OUZ56_018443 [Daphnia magna]
MSSNNASTVQMCVCSKPLALTPVIIVSLSDLDLVAAGIETTGNATVFLLHDILNNPEVKVRVYEELDRVFLSPEDAKTPPLLLKFKYLKVFITESLRMTPVAPNVARILENRLSFKLGSYFKFFRPPITQLDCKDYIIWCMQDCWHESPEMRPDFKSIRGRLKEMEAGLKPNIFDNIMIMMEKYTYNLEGLVQERTDQLVEEKKKTEALLHRVLPNTPLQVVGLLNELCTLFDSILENYDAYKVETISDAYMVTSGLPIRNDDHHAAESASLALHLSEISNFHIRHQPGKTLKLRIGIHSGPCVAGVV